jgi:integrase
MYQSDKPASLAAPPKKFKSARPAHLSSPPVNHRVCVLPDLLEPRHVSVAEEERLLAAARAEDARAYLNALTKFVAAAELEKLQALPPGRERAVAKRAALRRAKHLVQSTQRHPPPARLECLLRLMFTTGMHIREALRLRWCDIDPRTRCASWRDFRGLGPTYRIAPGLVERLKQISPADDSRPILTLDARAVEVHWRAICIRAGVPDLTPADVRFEALYRSRVNAD